MNKKPEPKTRKAPARARAIHGGEIRGDGFRALEGEDRYQMSSQ